MTSSSMDTEPEAFTSSSSNSCVSPSISSCGERDIERRKGEDQGDVACLD